MGLLITCSTASILADLGDLLVVPAIALLIFLVLYFVAGPGRAEMPSAERYAIFFGTRHRAAVFSLILLAGLIGATLTAVAGQSC